MANKETRVLKQDTLEILRQKTNEISLHVGDNEQLDALLADKTYSYTASAGQVLFDGADSNSKVTRFELSPQHTIDNTGGSIILEGVSSLDASYTANAIIYQGSSGSETWQAYIVSATTNKIIVRDSSGTFSSSADLKVGTSSPDTIANAKIARIIIESYPVAIARVYNNNTELTQGITPNGFFAPKIVGVSSITGSPSVGNAFSEGVTVYQNGSALNTQGDIESSSNWYGVLHSVDSGEIRFKTSQGSFSATAKLRVLGSSDEIAAANHGALTAVDSTYGSYIELTTPAANTNVIKVFSLDLVAAINELQDDIGTVENLTTSANDVVLAINEHDSELGTITAAAMATTASTVSGAIREHEDQIGNVDITGISGSNNTITGALEQIHNEIGDVTSSNLGTSASNLTAAVKEHEDQIGNENINAIDSNSNTITGALNQLHTEVGSLSLNTSATDLTAAINEHEADIGNMTLTGLSATDLSAAVRELRAELGNHLEIDDATGYSATTAVAGIKEIQGDIGDVDDLDTNAVSDLVAAINELENVLRDDTTQRTGYVMGTNANNVVAAINEFETVLRGTNSNYTLNTTAQNVRDAINEHESNIGNMIFGSGGPVDQVDPTNISAAIRVLDAEIGDTAYTDSDITTAIKNIQDDINVAGSLTTLNTTNKFIVGAINETDASIFNSVGSNRRTLSSLSTADKTSIVDAINEIYADIHTSGSVTLDTDASHLVGAINEIEGVFDASAKNITAGSNNFEIIANGIILNAEGDITLDANGQDIVLNDNATEFGRFRQASGQLEIYSGNTQKFLVGNNTNATFQNNLTVTNDLIVNNNVDIEGNVDVNGSIETDGLSINGTTVTATATELNVMDGNTAATSTTIADADRVVVNDNGTMKQVAVTDLTAYFDHEITNMPNLVQSGALDSGSITSGFGSIDVGTSTITGGIITGSEFRIGNAQIVEAELETIDGVTAGTVSASKAVVVDANKDITGFRNITLSGELDAGSLDISGNVDTDGTLDVALGSTLRGAVSITDNTASSSSATGALTVAGGVGIGEDLYVAGDLYVEGTRTELNVTTLEVEDTLVLAGNNLSSEPTSGGFGLEVGPITSPSGVASGVTGAHSIVYNYATDRWEADGSLILSQATLGSPNIEGAAFESGDNLDFTASNGVSVTTSKTGTTHTVLYQNTDRGSSQDIFKNIALPGSVTIVAAGNSDTVTFSDDDVVNITGNASNQTIALSHADVFTGTAGDFGQTSDQDGKYIKSLTLTAEGHISAITTGDFDTRYQATNPYWVLQEDSNEVDQVGNTDIVNFTSGGGIAVSGSKSTSNNIDTSTISIAHANTSDVTNLSSDNSGGTVLQDISLSFDTYGHTTARSIETVNLDNRYIQSFQVEDGDGTEVTIGQAKEWKFVEASGGGATIDINWSDVSTGSDADPYDLTFTVTNTDKGSSQNIFKRVIPENDAGTDLGTITADNNNDILYIRSAQVDSTAGITLGVDVSNDRMTIAHADTSDIANLTSNNSGGTVLQDITLTYDTYGHSLTRSIGTVNLDNRYEKLADIPSYDTRSISIDCLEGPLPGTNVEVIDTLNFTSNALGHVTAASATKRTIDLADFGWSAWSISDGSNSETVGGTGQTITFNDDNFLTQTYNTSTNQMTVGHPTQSGISSNTAYGNSTTIPVITTDSRGHVIGVSETSIPTYDNYYDWNVTADSGGPKSVRSNYTLDIEGGTDIITTASGSGSNLKVTVAFDDPGYLLATNEKTATLSVVNSGADGNDPILRITDGTSDDIRFTDSGNVTVTYVDDSTINIHGNTSPDVDVNTTNLKARLAQLDGTINIGDSGVSDNTIVIRGNLTVQGTQTTANQEVLQISDNEILLNYDYPNQLPTEDAFVTVARGSRPNASLKWNEATNRWMFQNGDSTMTYYNMSLADDDADKTTFTIRSGTTTNSGQQSSTNDGDAPITKNVVMGIRGGNVIATDIVTAISGDSSTLEINHSNVSHTDSTQTAATLSSGGTFAPVIGVTVNAQGHVTDVKTQQLTLPTSAVPNDGLLDINAGDLIDLTITGGDFTADKATETDITIHTDLSELTDFTGSVLGTDEAVFLDVSETNGRNRQKRTNFNNIPISVFHNDSNFTSNVGDITAVNITAGVGLLGSKNTAAGDHNQTLKVNFIDETLRSVTAESITTTANRTYAVMPDADGDLVVNVPWITPSAQTTFQVEDGDGNEVTISNGKEWKFREGGEDVDASGNDYININWTDTDSGTDTDPYDLTFSHKRTTRTNTTNNSATTTFGGNFTIVDSVTTNATGHVTGVNTKTITMPANPNTDTNRFLLSTATVDNGSDMILRYNMTNDGTNVSDSHDIAITAGSNITLTPGTNTFEIAATNTTYTAGTGLSLSGTTFNLRADQKAYFNNGLDVKVGNVHEYIHFDPDLEGGGARIYADQGEVVQIYKDSANSVIYFPHSSGPPMGIKTGEGSGSNALHFFAEESSTLNAKAILTSAGSFHVDDDITAFSTTTSSDAKLKENIQKVDNALELVCKLDGVTFDWKDKEKGSSAGVIAQNVEEVLPSAVSEVEDLNSDDTHKVVNYNQLSALFIEAIKELKEENKLLRDEIENLKSINS